MLITFGAILSRIIMLPDTDTEESANLHCQQNPACVGNYVLEHVFVYLP